MIWKGKQIGTIQDAMDALRDIHTKEDAQEYLRLARIAAILDLKLRIEFYG